MSVRVVSADPVPAPALPPLTPEGAEWPEQTLQWWAHWSVDPLAAEFRHSDWDELLLAALLHARMWQGDYKVAPELRLRMEKHGATAVDRLRLRIQYGAADEAEARTARRKRTASVASDRFSHLRAIAD